VKKYKLLTVRQKKLGEVFTGKTDSGKLYIIFCNHSGTPLKFVSSRQKKVSLRMQMIIFQCGNGEFQGGVKSCYFLDGILA